MRYLRNIILFFFASLSFINFCQGQDIYEFNFQSGEGEQGDTVCVDILVDNFTDISSLGWVIRFDPSILKWIEVDLENSDLNGGAGGNLISTGDFAFNKVEEGYINFVWIDFTGEGITVADNSVLYTVCFELIGDPCDVSDVAITPLDNELQVSIAIPGTTDSRELDQSEIVAGAGEITINPNGFVLSESHCSSEEGGNTGSITFAGSGGTGPYDWMIIGPSTASGSGLDDCETATVNDLPAGTYTIQFTDANNVVRNEIVEILSSTDFPFILELDGIAPTCFDRDNGRIIIDSVIGGVSPFTYEWSTFQFDSIFIRDLLAGEYSLTVTDANGCTTSATEVITVDTVKVDFVVINDPSCSGAADGLVSFFASGGTPFPGDQYEFDVQGTGSTFFLGDSPGPVNSPYSTANMPQGCFEVTVTDDLNCVSDPVEFCLESGTFSALTIDSMNVSCFGECDGSVAISAGATGNYVFEIRDNLNSLVLGITSPVTYTAEDLCPGLYTVRVTDNTDGCFQDTSFIITEPDLLILSVIDSVGPGCGGGDGMISFDATGGTEAFTYEWGDGFDQSSRVNLGGGDYSVTVTDMNGCKDSIMWTFGAGGDVGLSGIVCQAVTCESAMDGSVCASVTVGGNFTFTWEDSDGNSFGTGSQIDNLAGGIYYVTATDGSCTDVDTVIMAPGQTPSVDVVLTPPLCPNAGLGLISVSLSEGVMPAMFDWSNPPSTAIISSGQVFQGEVGTYNVHITDDNGCEADSLITIIPPSDTIVVVVSNIVANPCFGSCEGQATIMASGGPAGTGDYTFIFENETVPSTGGMITINTLCAGPNFVIAIDGQCATDTIRFDIPDATEISIDIDASTIVSPACAGNDDGSIAVEVTGGNGSNYALLWIDQGVAGNELTNLVAGEYYLQITDGNGCVVIDTVELIGPDPLIVTINSMATQEISCTVGSVGQIGVLTSGGNPGDLTFDWSPAVSVTNVAENLDPGFYSVTVTDVNNCTAETSYELITPPQVFAVVPTPDEPDCFGGQTCISIGEFSGGTGNDFTFTVANGMLPLPIDTCYSVFAGEYNISVFDSAGCSFDTTIVIAQPSQVSVDVGPDITIDLGTSSEAVSAFIVSELDIDSILWSPITDIECNTSDCQIVTFSPQSTTSYTITVIDENGCLATDDITVSVNLARNVFTPNIFSPNGDNRNDVFQLATGNGVQMVNYLNIYDRWGSKIFEDESYIPNDSDHKGWDGTMGNNGTRLEPGVYVFVAEVVFVDGVRVIYKGDVTLVR